MRIATLIIGLVLMLGVFVQSLIAAAGGSLASDKDLQNAAAWGILVALGYLVGSALVVAKPRFSMWTFATVGLIGILAGATSAFSDLIVWGSIALILAAVSWRGSIEKRRKDVVEDQHRADVALTAAAVRERMAVPTPVA
jgi:hypothetical protein